MIRSLIDLLRNLQSEEDCRLFLENIRWHGVPVCPHCGSKSEEHYKLTNGGIFRGLYKCKDCRERFTDRQEKATFLWQRSAVGNHGKRVHLKIIVIVKSERLVANNSLVKLKAALLETFF